MMQFNHDDKPWLKEDFGRRIALAGSLVLSSFAFFLSVGVYALTTGVKEIGDYMQARLGSALLLSSAVLLAGFAASLINIEMGFLRRYVVCLALTVCGSLLCFVFVFVRAHYFN